MTVDTQAKRPPIDSEEDGIPKHRFPDNAHAPLTLEKDGTPKHRFPDNAHAPLTLEKDGMPKHRFPNNANAPLDSKEEGMPTHRIPDSEITPRDLEEVPKERSYPRPERRITFDDRPFVINPQDETISLRASDSAIPYELERRNRVPSRSEDEIPPYEPTKLPRPPAIAAPTLRSNAVVEEKDLPVCTKSLPVIIKSSNGNTLTCVAIVDDQSVRTFIDPKVIEALKIPPEDVVSRDYFLRTLEGLNSLIEGSLVFDLEVRGVNERSWFKLTPALTNPNIPDTTLEMATPSKVKSCNHLKHLSSLFSNQTRRGKSLY